MEIPVLLQPITGNGYRASVGDPFQLSVEGSTRDEALAALRTLLEDRARQGDEIVTLQIAMPGRHLRTSPLWPDDEITRAWIQGIAEYRRQRNEEPDPWDTEAEPSS